MGFLLAAQDNEWLYVGGSYGLVAVITAGYAAWTIIRGRRVGRQLPPGERRWM
jgi:uncharacterized membrane protein YedE/YeeE